MQTSTCFIWELIKTLFYILLWIWSLFNYSRWANRSNLIARQILPANFACNSWVSEQFNIFLISCFLWDRVATSQLDLNSPTFPDFFGALFPDFCWPHDTDLMGTVWNPERNEEKFCTCNYWVFTNICLKIRDKLWVISARSFSLTFPDSRQKILNFPDFPGLSRRSKFSLMVATLMRSIPG